jgi:gliding motility-associated-like protein
MKKKFFLFALNVLLSITCYSQFSKTHYIPPVSNTEANGQDPQGQYLYISCPSITPINFNLIEIGGNTISGTVSRDTPYVYNIGSGYDTQLLIDSSEVGVVKNNKGYIIEAEDLVYVTVRLTSSPNNFQAGGLVSKGIAALGTQFRIGAFLNVDPPTINANHYTFATILATENNTVVSFSDIKPGSSLVNTGADVLPDITLNAGESYALAAEGPNDINRDALIGALISSNKPIVVNCGSFAGSNANSTNLDLGFDQIVSVERTGTEYIFIRGVGFDVTERPFVIAHEDNTEIFINGSSTPITTLNHGDYFDLDGTAFSANGNLYLRASKNVFAYQAIGALDANGNTSLANQNMHFLPPLSCQTPKSINNIPLINEVGGITDFDGTVCLVTKTGATLDFIINATNYTLASLAGAGYVVNGPFTVTGNPDYVTYTIPGLTGNVSVFSSKQIYLSYYGSSSFATYGGFYSGFTFKPEVSFLDVTQSDCIPNVELKVNALSGFDTYQWYFNNVPIAGATNSNYFPTQPGYYKVKATLTECGLDYFSDEIPVSNCPLNTDNDSVNNNVDQDSDNDGLPNCFESLGDLNINISNPAAGTISLGTYSNTFTGVVTNSLPASAIPFAGNSNGSFVTEIPPGKGYFVKYTLSFAQPQNVKVDYVTTANATDLINDNGEFIVSSNINQTVTVLNPNNQLLIDTNYDGLYENNVTQYSSFEIRFRVNGSSPLAAGTGTFKFLANQATLLSIEHRNLTNDLSNKATFRIVATCIPKDYDNDGIPDQVDSDCDNDGISDFSEVQGQTVIALSNTDTNNDGLDEIFGNGFTPNDYDGDGIPNYYDLDSDNDGILDLNESITDSDADGILNYLELDSDNDLCTDVVEAGFLDPNSDGILGNNPVITNNSGLVTSGIGYTNPNSNYTIPAPITITTQPINAIACELQTATFTVVSNVVNSYQWQVSTDNGLTWTDLTNNTTYSGVTTINLTVSNVSPSMVGYQYRVFLNKNGNSCGLYSNGAILTTYPLPVVASSISIVQCDDDTDGISDVNLTVKNNFISTNYLNETFTYYTTLLGAVNADTSVQIINPIAYTTATTTIYVRVVNANGCFIVTHIDVFVSATQIPPGTSYSFYTCDDYIDTVNNDYDGISKFDFSSVTPAIQLLLPSTNTYFIKYYRNEADALAEVNEITSISNYRNNGYPNQQNIWVRIDSTIDNACFGLGPYVHLTVEALPIANLVNATNIIRNCDDDQDGIFNFDTTNIQSTILNGQTNVTVTYTDALGTFLPSPLPNPFSVNTQITVTARVTNNSTQATNGPCFDEVTFQFIVDDLPEVFAPTTLISTICDDETDPTLQDGIIVFTTTNLETELINGQANVTINYFEADGITPLHDYDGNLISSPFPNTFKTNTKTIHVVITNNTNTTCSDFIDIPFIIHPVPNIDLTGDELICSNLPTFLVTLDAGINDGSNPNDYTYSWFLNGVSIPGANNYTLDVNTEGIYTVEVANIFGCNRVKTITVVASNIATIENIVVADLTDINTISITVSGSGDYVYALDEHFFQDLPIFTNVSIGDHYVYVKDLNGCGEVQQLVHVIGAPKYFTPNGDGINDNWNIKGLDTNFNSKSIIYIFDRFGQLLKQISPQGNGWDGTYNGTLLPADDYWFTANFEDGRSTKGHFSLKR